VGKRSDGFHDLETCMFPIPLYDILEILPSSDFVWRQSGLQIEGNTDDNLCVRAFRLVQSLFSIDNVYMHLHKRIPFGAGLGGGSSDAVFVLKGLNDLFSLNLQPNELRKLAGKLGSDCAFFVDATPQFAHGRGDDLSPLQISLENFCVLVVMPPFRVSTAQAYAGIRPSGKTKNIEKNILRPISEWKNCIQNDFETSIFAHYPTLDSIKKKLYDAGALYASMSGSGAAMYGIFETKPTNLTFKNMNFFYLC